MDAGDTFKYGRGGHLWVVVSDPHLDRAKVVIINVTTHRGIDSSCILQPGDHPFVDHVSCMRYDMARVVTDADLERHVSSHTIQLQEPVSPQLLDRIRQGAAITSQIAFQCRQVLVDQGLIEP